MQEAKDFREECDTLAALLSTATEADLQRVTLFKNWTVEDVIGHLHIWNYAAAKTLESREAFAEFFTFVAERMGAGEPHPVMQRHWFEHYHDGLKGTALLEAWRGFYPRLADAYEQADPEQRLAWAGPDMSARSKIIARQMETWAHGQEVFDVLGVDRKETDRIRNIAHLGVTTYSWTFRNRGEDPPKPKPYVSLISPSVKNWTWNEEQSDNRVEGNAVDFCQVVTQTRNVADTGLKTYGKTAERWMAMAQCFAGLPNDPPKKGERKKAA